MILHWEHQVTGSGYTVISGSEIRAKLPYCMPGTPYWSDDPVGRQGKKWSSTSVPQFSRFSQLYMCGSNASQNCSNENCIKF